MASIDSTVSGRAHCSQGAQSEYVDDTTRCYDRAAHMAHHTATVYARQQSVCNLLEKGKRTSARRSGNDDSVGRIAPAKNTYCSRTATVRIVVAVVVVAVVVALVGGF